MGTLQSGLQPAEVAAPLPTSECTHLSPDVLDNFGSHVEAPSEQVVTLFESGAAVPRQSVARMHSRMTRQAIPEVYETIPRQTLPNMHTIKPRQTVARTHSSMPRRPIAGPHTAVSRQTFARRNCRTHVPFAQRLRQRACKSLVAQPLKRKRRQRNRPRLQMKPKYPRMVDDDSSQEQQEDEECASLLPLLLSHDGKEIEKIRFTTHGNSLHLDGLESCTEQVVHLSTTVAMIFTEGVDPTSCRALQSGRLAPLGPVERYQLQRLNGAWVLVADSHTYFNFVLRRWQPLSMAASGPYAPVKDLLYVAFVPQKVHGPVHGRSTLFVKLGYRELVNGETGDHDALIGYLEKKSAPLQLTNVTGAGVFVFDPPSDHHVFARPGRAAEASLKTELLHSRDLIVTPSGHCADVGSFSASLEYFFLETSASGRAPLAALTRLLQSFTGDPALLPQCAVASRKDGDLRRGKKRLQPWSGDLGLLGEVDVPSAPSLGSAIPTPMHALRSRAKCAQMRGRVVHKAGLKVGRKTC